MRIYATFIAERYLALCEKKRQNVLKIKNFILLPQRILRNMSKQLLKSKNDFIITNCHSPCLSMVNTHQIGFDCESMCEHEYIWIPYIPAQWYENGVCVGIPVLYFSVYLSVCLCLSLTQTIIYVLLHMLLLIKTSHLFLTHPAQSPILAFKTS